jgi:hypothetical protein
MNVMRGQGDLAKVGGRSGSFKGASWLFRLPCLVVNKNVTGVMQARRVQPERNVRSGRLSDNGAVAAALHNHSLVQACQV